MINNKTTAEKQLKRLIIKTHQEIFGKGPEEAWVKIFYNMAMFYCSQSLTQIEEFLLGMPGGEEEVRQLRRKIISFLKLRLYSQIENLTGVKVLGLTGDICTNSGTLFGAILFQNEIGNEGG